MKFLFTFLLACLSSATAFANLEVAAIASYARTQYEASGGANSVNAGSDPRMGALLLLPLFPGLSLRTGALFQERNSKGNDYGLGFTTDMKESILQIPLNIQVGLPVTSLYLFGGVMFDSRQSASCSSSDGLSCSAQKFNSDNAVNLGVGYDLISFALFRVAVEAEYQKGTKNLLSSGTGELKQATTGVNLVAAFGF